MGHFFVVVVILLMTTMKLMMIMMHFHDVGLILLHDKKGVQMSFKCTYGKKVEEKGRRRFNWY